MNTQESNSIASKEQVHNPLSFSEWAKTKKRWIYIAFLGVFVGAIGCVVDPDVSTYIAVGLLGSFVLILGLFSFFAERRFLLNNETNYPIYSEDDQAKKNITQNIVLAESYHLYDNK
jgi:hypothetical protein